MSAGVRRDFADAWRLAYGNALSEADAAEFGGRLLSFFGDCAAVTAKRLPTGSP